MSEIKITEFDIEHLLKNAGIEIQKVGEKTTVAVVTLQNGFVIVESSSCVDPENYDEEKGTALALDRVREKLWMLEGYRLQCYQNVLRANVEAARLKEFQPVREIARSVTGHECTMVMVMDERDKSGACHDYVVVASEPLPIDAPNNYRTTTVHLQKGPRREVGLNGCMDEDLLAIVADRLDGFQNGPFSCDDNSRALANVEAALGHLRHRMEDRRLRGVEGTNIA